MKNIIGSILKEKGITIKKCSDDTGITYPAMHSLVKNKTTSISFEIQEKICKFLNKRLDEVFIIED